MSDAWVTLRRLTAARIALGHAGSALPTAEQLSFQLAHARARDAVAQMLDVPALVNDLARIRPGVVHVRTQARDLMTFLANPHAGGLPDDKAEVPCVNCDVAFVVADGLSAGAVQRHAVPLLQCVLAGLPQDCSVGPLVVVTGGRVAVGDEIGARMNAQVVAVLIGERPGLSAPDSMGVYVTYAPAPGRSNAERNCISNIRPEGLGYDAAATKLLWLLEEALRRKLSGISLTEPR